MVLSDEALTHVVWEVLYAGATVAVVGPWGAEQYDRVNGQEMRVLQRSHGDLPARAPLVGSAMRSRIAALIAVSTRVTIDIAAATGAVRRKTTRLNDGTWEEIAGV